MSRVKIKTRTVGQCFGTEAIVIDCASGETIHETATCPLGFTAAARSRAESWAIEHGHETLEMAVASRAAHAGRGRGATIAGLKSDGWSGQEIGWALKGGTIVKIDDDHVGIA